MRGVPCAGLSRTLHGGYIDRLAVNVDGRDISTGVSTKYTGSVANERTTTSTDFMAIRAGMNSVRRFSGLLAICRRRGVFAKRVHCRSNGSCASIVLFAILPLIVFVKFLVFVGHEVVNNTNNNKIFDMNGSHTRVFSGSSMAGGVAFTSITNLRKTGRRIRRVIRFLHRPSGCASLNNGVPGKTLLMNPPNANGALLTGTITNRTSIPFFSLSNSSFIRVFININTSHIHSLFHRTGRGSPYVIFVSRVSTVNHTHNGGDDFGSGSRHRGALGRLLARVSNFNSGSNIVVLTTAGHTRVLSGTLLHTNHFSHRVRIRLPSVRRHGRVFRMRVGPLGLSSAISISFLTHRAPNFSNTSVTGIYGRTTLATTHGRHGTVKGRSFLSTISHVVNNLRGGAGVVATRRGGGVTCRRTKRTAVD